MLASIAFGLAATSARAAEDEGAAEPEAGNDANQVAAAAAQEWVDNLWKAIGLHNKARLGEKNAARDAISLLNDLLKEQPEHAIALAYLGSSHTLRARTARNTETRIRYVNRGLRYVDQAMEIAPDNFVVLTVSARVNGALPPTFRRGKKAHENALALDAIYSADPAPGRARHMIPVYQYLHSRAVAAEDDEAAEAWSEKSRQVMRQVSEADNAE